MTMRKWVVFAALGPIASSLVNCAGGPPADSPGAGGVIGVGGEDHLGSGGERATGGRVGSGGRGSGGHESAGGRSNLGGEGGFGGGDSPEQHVSSGGQTSSGGQDSAGGQVGSGGLEGLGGEGNSGDCEGDEQYDALADACLLPIPCNESASPFGGGNGTELSPYLICSVPQLLAVRDAAAGGHYYVLARSLDLSDVVDWEPIGYGLLPAFVGTFQGAGRALVGLVIDSPGSAGLFGEIVMGSRVENLKLLDFDVTGENGVGILAVGNAGSIEQVETSGYVSGYDDVGGLVGSTFEMFYTAGGGTINKCSSSATVDGHSRVGGIVGQAAAPVYRVHTSGSVWASGDRVGGVVGSLRGDTLYDAHASGDVEGNASVGGLVGSMDISLGGLMGDIVDHSYVQASSARGNVTAMDDAGGLAGTTTGFILKSLSSGTVSSGGTAGGLVGRLAGDFTKIGDSYALGDVHGGQNVGGLVGVTDHGQDISDVGIISFTYAMGVVTGGEPKGGLIGAEAAAFAVTTSYYSDASPVVGPGTPLSVAAFADPDSFVGWTFDGVVWEMSPALGRPVLFWE